ncbi:hypothetical protein MMC08_007245 [Hypocenomyce scalaris]|nr:hypothetical protein [Hypocenomyce scalaris]
MADLFSTAAGAVGVVSLSLQLLGGCIKGFVLLSTAQNLGKDASTIVCMLELQEIQLTEWARRAGLLTDDAVLDRRLNGRAVEETLLHLQKLLLDTEQLKTKYGLWLKPQANNNQQTTTALRAASLSEIQRVFTSISDETRRQIMTRAEGAQEQNIFKQLWWAAVDKEKIKKLVGDVHFLVRGLWHLLDPWRHDDLLNSITAMAANIVTLNNRFDQLTSLHEALNALRGTLSILPDASLKTLAVSAEVKALRVGLGDDDQEQSLGQKFNAPKRQELLQRLERLSRLRLMNFKSMKKHETMGLADYGEQRVFVEWKHLNPSLRSKILPRVENLAALLNVPKDQTFRSLSCKGIVEEDGKVSFVFDHPFPSCPEEPRSLLELFSAKDGLEPPSLSDRIRLALQIVRTVQNFHRAGWLHKSLRSENILFFPTNNASTVTCISDPVLAGFNFARFDSPTEISEQPSAGPGHDIYRHPSAMGEPSLNFSALMDVYSLGTVMLEIAEWRALRYIVDSVVDVGAENVPLSKLAGVQEFLLSGRGKGGTSKLRTKMGNIFTSVCLMCLGGKVEEENLSQDGRFEPQGSLLDVAVQRLKSCNI